MRTAVLNLDQKQIAEICRRNSIRELSLFGSILRDDFQRRSDVDVLLQFEDGKTLTLESYVAIQDKLSAAFDGREVDLVELKRLADPYRRHEILRTREIIYGH